MERIAQMAQTMGVAVAAVAVAAAVVVHMVERTPTASMAWRLPAYFVCFVVILEKTALLKMMSVR
tara:strand:- start:1498 stop:1692 length:195 start_codon:yes stop_codon:yes gene_type:complete